MIEVWRPGRAEGRARPHRKHRERGRHFGSPRRGRRRYARADAGGCSRCPGGRRWSAGRSRGPTRLHARAPASRNAIRAIAAGMTASSDSTVRAGTATGRRRTRAGTSGKTGVPNAGRKAPDPNSPFAKLAALKAQLEADAKERR